MLKTTRKSIYAFSPTRAALRKKKKGLKEDRVMIFHGYDMVALCSDLVPFR